MTEELQPFDATRTLWDREAEAETARGITVAKPGAALMLGPVIGKGGMSEIREARQQVLDRTVAIKRVSRRPVSRTQERLLLQEAWTTGALEHPNIVPVHDIQFEGNEPLIVMKHIEGVEWARVMDDPAATFPGIDDPFDWNLRILLQVCNAIEFAHSRGIVHRDLKPENVMIGHFGEVYVLDWGLAVALEDRFRGRVPLAADQKGLAGTPAYMPPEMAEGDGRLVTERTDVYLLGGILHRIVAKRPPRTGQTLGGLMAAIQWEDISIDPGWPLADLLVIALHRSPDNRPVSVAAFRRAIRHHLDHRESARLVQAARERLAALEQALQLETDRFELYDLFGACRFAFEEALKRWPDAPGAREGLQRAIERMARYELANDDDRSASLLIRQLDTKPAELQAEVERLAKARARAESELTKLQADASPLTGTRARVIAALLAGGVWIGPPAIGAIVGITPGYPREAFVSGTTTLLSFLVMGILWSWLTTSRINRVLVAVVILSPLLASILLAACWLAGVSDAQAVALRTFAFVCMSSVAAVLADWKLLPGVLGFVAALWIGATWPGAEQITLALANLFIVVNAVLVWFPASLGLTRR